MKYTLKIQLKNGGEVSSEPFELPGDPDNFHLEAENFHLETEKEPLPMCYRDLIDIAGVYITSRADIKPIWGLYAEETAYNVFVTEAQAKSALAYAQLTQLMKAYNGDWTPDWDDMYQDKYVIDRTKSHCKAYCNYTTFCFLAFPTEELRDEFLKNFEPLIKTFYQI